MAELHLIIADQALRAAIAEQLNLAGPEGVRIVESASLPASLPPEPVAFLLDAADADQKILSLLDSGDSAKKPKLFFLGETKESENLEDRFNIESFAKPLRLGHLLARVQFYFQSLRNSAGSVSFGPFRLEPALRQAVREESGAVVRLTEKETQLLEYLGRSEQPVPREELLAAIWGYDGRIDTHTLETHIYRLRRKLDPDGQLEGILIVQQGAYSLAPPRAQ